ncbi:MAG: type II toxin-antitoxin system prevent-host-death family antitoxin [Holosporaceae bacterium]|nr:type II toxin-antitoxin system prevent-host-death family antitoxin [Holosporaceae bacterium]
METVIPAAKFKQNCLQLLEKAHNGETFCITKRGTPMARLTPICSRSQQLFGAMKNSCQCHNVTDPIDVEWENV